MIERPNQQRRDRFPVLRAWRGELDPYLDDYFELWRPRVVAWLITAAGFLVMYWVAWLIDRGLVASTDTSEYVAFEQAFPLADALLAAALVTAATALWRRRPSAFVWLSAVGGAGAYLCGLDVLYDLQHNIYSSAGSGGAIELSINVFTALSSIGIVGFAWIFRRQLLGISAEC